MKESASVVRLFEQSVIDLMKFHYKNDYPFSKEADAQSYLFMKMFKKLKERGLLFTKDKYITIRSTPKYPFKGHNQMFDLGVVSRDLSEIDESGYRISSDNYRYIIATEMKMWFSHHDIEKLRKILKGKKAEHCYFISLDRGKEPAEELLKSTGFPHRFYKILPIDKILNSRIKVFYSFIFDNQKGRNAESFEIKKKGNVTVLTQKGVIV